MNRSTLRTLAVAVQVAFLVASVIGCASGGASPGASTDASAGTAGDVAAAPAAPAKKPFEPPAWPAAVYTNEELGFSVHYPADFEQQPAQGGGLFTAASPMMVPRIDVNRADAPPDTTLAAGLAALAEGLGQTGGGEATVKESRETKLRDEVTPAIEGVVEWSFQGFPLQSFVVGTIQDGSMVTVTVTGMQGGDVAELSEIAYTLYFE
jgi:hypothetical protein